MTVTEVVVSSLAEIQDAARAAETPLLWLRDARATPAPDALEALMEAGITPAVSLPVSASGDPVELLLGRFAADDEALVSGAQRRQVPLRHTYVVSMLVERDAVLGLDPPDPGRFGVYAGNEWTSRLFARHGGSLVPASRVLAGPVPRASWRAALRTRRAGAWRRRETLRELRRGLSLSRR